MKTRQKFEPTHRITYRDGKGELVYEVMLVDGAGYTQLEWDADATADFEMNEEGEWTLAGHAFNGDVETLPKPVPCCSRCGSTRVESTSWVEYREDGSERVVNCEGPFGNEEGNWCHDCQEHLDITYPTYTPSQHRDRQMNNAARERGPELLDALIEMLPHAHSYLLGKVKLMSDDTYERAILESDGLPTGWKLAEDYRKAKQLITQITTGKEGDR